MIRNGFIRKLTSVHRSFLSVKYSSSQINIEKLEQEQESTSVDVVDEDAILREEEIERKRNKSRLRDTDRNLLFEKNPYPEPMFEHHGSLKYLRRAYGRYGQSSGVNPSICWPLKQELDDAREHESVKYPYTIPDMVAEAKQKRKLKQENIMARQAEIVKRMEKLETWKQELYERIAKKENEANVAKQRKERLIEEVKRHFGYTVDPRDDKFKEMLEKKEKEQKKIMKEARRKAKEEKMVEKLLKNKKEKASGEAVVEES